MEIRRHCNERLPGGERLWRKAARIAEFEGTLNVYGFGQKRFSRKELYSPNRGKYGITLGFYRNNSITVFVHTSPCAITDPKKPKRPSSPLETFCHELGHHRQLLEGKTEDWIDGRGTKLADWRENAAERSADAYGRWLYAQLRERK